MRDRCQMIEFSVESGMSDNLVVVGTFMFSSNFDMQKKHKEFNILRNSVIKYYSYKSSKNLNFESNVICQAREGEREREINLEKRFFEKLP